MNDEDIKKIGDEFEHFLNPVYEQLDRIEKKQDEHSDKIDALTADVVGLQQQVGVMQDDVKTIKEQNRSEHDEIRQHVGMSPFSSVD